MDGSSVVLGLGGPAERPAAVSRTMGQVRRSGVLPAEAAEGLVLAVPALVRGGKVTLGRLVVPVVAVVVMLVGFLVGRSVGETDAATGIVLLSVSLVAGGVGVLWLLVDGLREVRRFTRQVGTAADLVELRGPVILALTDGVLWCLGGRGTDLRVTGRVPVEDVTRFTIGVTPTPSIDVTFHDGSYLALRAAYVDHAHWLREASQRWREDVVDARERGEAAETDVAPSPPATRIDDADGSRSADEPAD